MPDLKLGSEPRRTVRLRQSHLPQFQGLNARQNFANPPSNIHQDGRHHRAFRTRPTAVCCGDGPLADEPNLRPPDPGFADSAPHTSAPKSGWGEQMRASKMLCSFGPSTATCFRGGSSNSSQFCDTGQSGPQGVARPSPPNLIAGVAAFSGYSGWLENVGSAPGAFRRSEEE